MPTTTSAQKLTNKTLKSHARDLVISSLEPTDTRILKNEGIHDVPKYWDMLRSLHFDLSDNHKVETLRDCLKKCGISYDADIIALCPSISCHVVLKLLGMTGRYSFLIEDTKELLAPKYWLCNALALEASRKDRDQIRSKLMGLLCWVNTPNLVQIDIDLFRVDPYSHTPLKNVVTLATNRVRENRDRRRSLTQCKKVSWVEPTNQNRLDPIHSDTYPYFENNDVVVKLIPSNNRGKHICSLQLTDKSNGAVWSIGTIRHTKGKLFYMWDVLSSDKQQLDKIKKQPSYASHRASKARDRAAKELRDINSQISQAKQDQRKSKHGFNALGELTDLDTARSRVQNKLNQINGGKAPEIANNPLNKVLPVHLTTGVLSMWKYLGIYPNKMLKSLPLGSPLASPKFWANAMGVLVIQDHHTHPIKFHSDLR